MIILKNLLNGLKDKSDLDLIKLVKEKSDSEAFVTICIRYENIFYKVCNKYRKRIIEVGLDCSDVFEEKHLIIFHCINTFNPSKKTRLGSWIGNFTRYMCLNFITTRKHILPSCDDEVKNMIENSQYYNSGKEAEEVKAKEDKTYISDALKDIKDQRIIDIINLRFFSDRKVKWNEVASIVGTSVQTAINLKDRGLKILRKKINSEKFLERI